MLFSHLICCPTLLVICRDAAVALSLLLPVTVSAAISADAGSGKLRGVLAARLSSYAPTSAGNWKCLSEDKETA